MSDFQRQLESIQVQIVEHALRKAKCETREAEAKAARAETKLRIAELYESRLKDHIAKLDLPDLKIGGASS